MPDAIQSIVAEEILDSRANPTVEVTIILNDGTGAKASVPSGASTGIHEAHELRDGDEHRYGGKGVLKAIDNVNNILGPALVGMKVSDQKAIDDRMRELDGSENKSKLGANALLGISLAAARAAAKSRHLPLYRYIADLYGTSAVDLPIPLVNVINGGMHASTNLNIQEFWIVPAGIETFAERLRAATEIFQNLGTILRQAGKDTDVGNEGGYAPNFDSNMQAMEMLIAAMKMSGYPAGEKVFLGMDMAASHFFDADQGLYSLTLDKTDFTPAEFVSYILGLIKEYPIRALEDPLAEEDWDSWAELTKQVAQNHPDVKIIGDDLFCTNTARLQKGIDTRVANAILIKPNQIGTLSETLDAIRLARQNKYQVAVSHRSGETTDSFIADLAVGVAAEYIKTGSVARGERTVKYNRLLHIERELHANKK